MKINTLLLRATEIPGAFASGLCIEIIFATKVSQKNCYGLGEFELSYPDEVRYIWKVKPRVNLTFFPVVFTIRILLVFKVTTVLFVVENISNGLCSTS
ncbi:hypothetical protein CEXT_110011 [Caerostris extrusa]|uniref:Uncharacterized protein n=1 Tax=Caerostris extrusa TaxID=172846 RepID=A0AAV4P0W2_CAEEX|nr:hypothetical protein CEXT_110011 [Caerostris extrusa]